MDNDILISEDILDFIKDNIFAVLDESIDVLKCYTIYKRNGNIYYGSSIIKHNKIRNPSWAQIQWDDGDNCPGKCVLYIDLSKVKYKKDTKTIFEADVNVIIQSLKSSVSFDANNINIVHKCSLFKTFSFYCVSVESISAPSFVIPDIGSKYNDNYLYVYRHDTWKNNF